MTTVTNEELELSEFRPSDAAQQLSACACVSTLPEPARCDSPLCIGHSPSSAQQAMRASGVAIHPAQIAAFPAIRPKVSARAARRWRSFRTGLGCSTGEAVSNERTVESEPGAGIEIASHWFGELASNQPPAAS